MDQAVVIRPRFEPGRRIIAVSDVHGNLDFFRGLMDQVGLTPSDILVLVGDLVEKGPDSLTTLRFIMELAERNTVYGLRGNCDNLVSEFVAARGEEERFYRHYVDVWRDRCLLVQMGHAAGFETRGAGGAARSAGGGAGPLRPGAGLPGGHAGDPAHPRLPLRPRRRGRRGAPGGAGRLEVHENDDFLSQGHSFRRWCIVGHWPVTLYHPHVPSAAPLLAEGRHIASIDGGCSLKVDGQLNALVLPERPGGAFSWFAYDGLPTATALDPQAPSADSVTSAGAATPWRCWSGGTELSLCRHLETGRVLEVLTEYLYVDRGVTRCEDSTDYRLAVRPGDTLSVVRRISDRALVKKDGVTGWYFGRLAH